ncbi:hypothetical protein P154DRAFT_214559 [Amniculicola lignicola CBS 123094]|uniref:Uncharacterized protein n=1 Tax=Amniculicola lignicola CBS 123094 TaxID=1392246 RepID=A0A6A5WHH0_9PLEO|nr:hypothetical protein P154DRAFT_214559 [Amniculicola lignicola CBS 123094]
MVLASHMVIRWREAEFISGSYVSQSHSSVEKKTATSGESMPPAVSVTSTPTKAPDRALESSTPSSTNSSQLRPERLSTGGLVASVVSSIVGVSAIVLGLLLCRAGRKRSGNRGSIELDDRKPVGCRVLYEGQSMISPEAE